VTGGDREAKNVLPGGESCVIEHLSLASTKCPSLRRVRAYPDELVSPAIPVGVQQWDDKVSFELRLYRIVSLSATCVREAFPNVNSAHLSVAF